MSSDASSVPVSTTLAQLGLTTTPSAHAGPKRRFLAYVVYPLDSLVSLFLTGLPAAVRAQLAAVRGVFAAPVTGGPWARARGRSAQAIAALGILLSPRAWHTPIVAAGLPVLLAGSDENWRFIKAPLLARARGAVLELGAGDGKTLAYYNASRIDHLYLLEPFDGLHDALRAALRTVSSVPQGRGLERKTTILPIAAEDAAGLAAAGLAPASLDTVVCVQVLCSVPDPKPIIASVARLLKPGGTLILFEHARSSSRLTQSIQDAWNIVWTPCVGGCVLGRPALATVGQAGPWKHVIAGHPTVESDADLFPHDVAIFTKA